MRKKLFVCLALLGAPVTWALSNEMLVESCWESAEVKLMAKADRQDCVVQINEMKVEAIDNRWYNPSKYVWFSCPGACRDGRARLEVMVQYYRAQCD